jgi:hypothetical protein
MLARVAALARCGVLPERNFGLEEHTGTTTTDDDD